MSISIANVSLRSFCIALRWARIKGYPNNLDDWTGEQSEKIQKVCEEWDRRDALRWENFKIGLENSFEK